MLAAPITLTLDQQKALDAFNQFLLDPLETVFVLRGYSGCGKSTLIRILLEKLPGLVQMAQLVDPKFVSLNVALTATTNKAAENLSQITGLPVSTIHSFLGLRVSNNYQTGQTTLSAKHASVKTEALLFIDEASYIDHQLLQHIFQLTHKSKVVFIGDPAQLIPVGQKSATVFDSPFKGAELTEVVRQLAGNPIVGLSTKFRETVNTGQFFSFTPDGNHIQHLSKADFDQAIVSEFTRPDWRFNDSKILAWTNKRVVAYNHYVNQYVTGNPHFQEGDYAVCNHYISNGKSPIKTDQMVQITEIGEDVVVHDVAGNYITVDGFFTAFQPKLLQDKLKAIKKARHYGALLEAAEMEQTWIDLRAAYACTINKAQGSTFDRVFIDLGDIRRCNSGDQIARMLYVAVSRARHQVVLTGDLV
jgi:ATP-dependent exoDNAse (exonuclease V) alpha subunit